MHVSEKYCYDKNLSPQVPKNINFRNMFKKNASKAVKKNHAH